MIFKDRREAGQQLALLLSKDKSLKQQLSQAVVLSLLRGGIIVGEAIAQHLKIPNLPLVVTKIQAPANPELAIGAVCIDVTYLEKRIIKSLGIEQTSIIEQINSSQVKQQEYFARFNIKKDFLQKQIKDKIVIVTDDGIATGSTIRAALLYARSKKAKRVILAVPVAPSDFARKGIDLAFILYQDPNFSSVSQYYQDFPQVGDEEVKKLIQSTLFLHPKRSL